MELRFSGNKIELPSKELNELDRFVLEFTNALSDLGIRYVLISGYVCILFGRSRSTEDVDLFIEPIDSAKMRALWERISKGFECINATDAEDALEYLLEKTAIRFSRPGNPLPNIEVKFPKDDLDRWALQNRKEVVMNTDSLFVSPIEMQIAFKLYLGSDKDIEDARHLFKVFKDFLDQELLDSWVRTLKMQDQFRRYLL